MDIPESDAHKDSQQQAIFQPRVSQNIPNNVVPQAQRYQGIRHISKTWILANMSGNINQGEIYRVMIC